MLNSSNQQQKRLLIGVWNYYEELNYNNRLFMNPQVALGENLLRPVNLLYQEGLRKGVIFQSLDLIDDFDNIDAFLFFDFPRLENPLVEKALESGKPNVLVINETEAIKPDGWLISSHTMFHIVFTWNDTWVDGEKYLKFYNPTDLPDHIEEHPNNQRKLCTLIASNKLIQHPQELYSKRIEAIRWFEEHKPQDFDLFGIGWDTKEFPSYRGKVDLKSSILQKYRFSICYENTQGYTGYITEKIFDCFKAGCVPIYWGASNIGDYIPSDCYVDRRQFKNFSQVYHHISHISELEYQNYITNIDRFLASEKAKLFSCDHFCDLILHTFTDLIEDSKKPSPLITIAIPTYNHGKYIGRAIESVLSQGEPQLEIYILDNASTDDTQEVVKRYLGDPRVHYICHSANRGGGYNWNKALQVGTGKYLKILSADDFLLPGHLKGLLDALESHPECDLVYTPCIWVDENEKELQLLNHPGHLPTTYYGGRNELVDLLVYDSYITPSAAIIRRSASKKIPGFDVSIRGGGDWDYWIRMAERNPNFIFIKEAKTAYRVHQKQDSKHFYASEYPLLDHIRILEKAFSSSNSYKLAGFQQPIAQHLNKRISMYPQKVVTPLQPRLEALASILNNLNNNPTTLLRANEAAIKIQDKTNQRPLVSVIVPTYNRKKELPIALKSITSQFYPNKEIVIVNDAGEDVPDIDKFSGNQLPVQYIRHETNLGAGGARNTGFKAAKGKYITFLDDDDQYYPHHLGTLVHVLENNPLLVGAYTDALQIDWILNNNQHKEVGRSVTYSVDFSSDLILSMNYIPILCLMVKADVIKKVGGFDPNLKALEDWEWIIRLTQYGLLKHVPLVTAEYQVRHGGKSRNMIVRDDIASLYRLIYSRNSQYASPLVRQNQASMFKQMTGMELGVEMMDGLGRARLTYKRILEADNVAEAINFYKNDLNKDVLYVINQEKQVAEAQGNRDLMLGLESLGDYIASLIKD